MKVLVGAIVLSIASLAVAADRGISVEPVASVIAAGNAGLFMGVNEFIEDDSLRPLAFAVNDAVGQAHLFVNELKLISPKNTFLALAGEPTTEATKTQLANLTRAGVKRLPATKTRVLMTLQSVANLAGHETDMLVVSFSSHGFEERGLGYVMPSDGSRGSLQETAIGLRTIEQKLDSSRAGKRLLLWDACREKTSRETRGSDATMSPAFRQALAAAEGRAMLASCDAGQLSLENPDLGHGVFTYFLLEALRGKATPDERGFITLGSVSDYLSKTVPDWILRNRPDAKRDTLQKPWFKGPKVADLMPLAVSSDTVGAWSKLLARKEAALQYLDAARKQHRGLLSATLIEKVETTLDAIEKERLVKSLESAVEMLEELKPPASAPKVRGFVSWWQTTGANLLLSEPPPPTTSPNPIARPSATTETPAPPASLATNVTAAAPPLPSLPSGTSAPSLPGMTESADGGGGGAVDQVLARANEMMARGDFNGVQALYEQTLRSDPNNVAVRLKLGLLHNQFGRLDDAIAAYKAVYRLAPQTANIRSWLGELCLHKGDLRSAFTWLNEEVTANPNNPWAHSFMGSYYAAQNDIMNRDRAFRYALSLDQNVALYRAQNGQFLLNCRQFQRALVEFIAAGFMNPNIPASCYGAAICYEALGDRMNAIACYQRYLQLDGFSEWAVRARQEIMRLQQGY
jgi:tetratricopeptide (TPR) repeat protein